MKRKQSLRGVVHVGFLVVFTLAVLCFFPRDALVSSLQHIRSLNVVQILPLLALQTLVPVLIAMQWSILLSASIGSGAPRWHRVLPTYLVGTCIEAITPSAKLGAEATRVALFRSRFGISGRDVLSAMLIHGAVMATSLSALLPFMAAVSYPLLAKNAPGALGGVPLPVFFGACMVAAVAGISGTAYLIRSRRFGINTYGPRRILTVSAIALLIWMLYPLRVALAATILGINGAIPAVPIATYGAYIAGLLPLTPGGLGSYEATMILLFRVFGVPAAEATAVTILSRVVSYWWPLILSVGTTLVLLFTGSLRQFSLWIRETPA